MVKILENKKHVFWQAFFVTLLFFLIGLLLGVYLEQIRTENVNIALYDSEASLYDSLALGMLIEDLSLSCEDFKEASVDFADEIYWEAGALEKFDDSSELTNSLKIIHRKYDLLRTLLWMNIISAKEKCEIPMNTIVYLYIYDTEDLQIKSRQIVWSRILGDLKSKKGNEIILIPIAVDQDITSLEYLIKSYDIDEFPAVIVNEKKVIMDLSSVEDIEMYLE
jgi:hypothetical protein